MSQDVESPENSGEMQGTTNRNERGQFKPGVSGNPAGKPKGSKHFATLISEALKEKIEVTLGGKKLIMPAEQAMVKAMILETVKGNVKAFEALTDRHDGKPHQSMEVEVSEPPKPIMPLPNRTGQNIVRTDDSDTEDITAEQEN